MAIEQHAGRRTRGAVRDDVALAKGCPRADARRVTRRAARRPGHDDVLEWIWEEQRMREDGYYGSGG